jgi:DNA-binding MarR family transcriptional regulator
MNHDGGPGLNPARPLLMRLLNTGAAVEAQLERCLEPTGLSLAKLGVLRHLVAAGRSLPLGQLAERLSCVKSNVTQLVDRLEADGFVRRVADPDDRRSVLAEITPAGREAYDRGARANEAAQRQLMQHLSADDQNRLALILEQLRSIPQ